MPFPFLFLTLSLILGICISDILSLPLASSALGLSASLVLAWLFFALKKNKPCLVFILAACLFLGSGMFAVFNNRYEQNGLRRLPQNTYGDFYGTLYLSPSPGLDRDILYLRVKKVVMLNKEELVSGNLRISVPHSAEFASPLDYVAGDKLKVSAQIVPAREYRNFAEPFSRMYLKALLIHNLAATKSRLLVEKTGNGSRGSLLRLMSILRQRCQRKIEQNFAAAQNPQVLSSEGAIFETLILGGRGRLSAEDTTALQKTGLFHLFAISGAHIGIISFFIFLLLKSLRVPTRLSYGLLIIILIFYSFLVEGRASVLRAAIMSIAFLLGKLFWKDVHLINTISLSAFVLLLFNPFQLFDLGFELTYAATFSIILFFPKFMAHLPKLPLKASETFAMSLSAQLGVLPFIATSFHRIIFSGLILNFIGIPLVGIIMAAGYIFLPISFMMPALARPLAAGIHFLIKVFMASTHVLDGAAFLSYRIPTPPLPVVIGYFVFLLLFFLPDRFKKFKPAVFLGFAVCFGLLIFYPFSSASKDLKVTFIDVGQGDSILVEFPGRKKMLIDGGGLPIGTFDIGENVVSPFLWSKGIKTIDYLVLSHAHPDHLNGLVAVANNFRIGEFWETTSPPGDQKYVQLKNSLVSVPQHRIFRGYARREGDVRMEVLSPKERPSLTSSPDNDQSLVLRLSYGSTSFLLTADIGVNTEQEILDGGGDIRSRVFKSPHHGSNFSSSKPFLGAVAPEIIVISVGRGAPFGLPHPEIIDRYRQTDASIYRTDLHGAVEISSNGRGLKVRTAVRE